VHLLLFRHWYIISDACGLLTILAELIKPHTTKLATSSSSSLRSDTSWHGGFFSVLRYFFSVSVNAFPARSLCLCCISFSSALRMDLNCAAAAILWVRRCGGLAGRLDAHFVRCNSNGVVFKKEILLRSVGHLHARCVYELTIVSLVLLGCLICCFDDWFATLPLSLAAFASDISILEWTIQLGSIMSGSCTRFHLCTQIQCI